MQKFSCFIVLTALTWCTIGQDWSYEESNGPEHWEDTYPDCGDEYQSPINIDTKKVVKITTPDKKNLLQFDDGYKMTPLQMTITNTGHGVMLTVDEDDKFQISRGPLTTPYNLAAIEFHWGADDSHGSEDQVNKKSFAMQQNMISYQDSYGSYQQAKEILDGLTVLSTFLRIDDDDNPDYSEIVDALPHVMKPNTSHQFLYTGSLEALLPGSPIFTFMFRGSMTSPPCIAILDWILYGITIPISSSQVAAFRQIMPGGNIRPIQDIEGRKVKVYIKP